MPGDAKGGQGRPGEAKGSSERQGSGEAAADLGFPRIGHPKKFDCEIA